MAEGYTSRPIAEGGIPGQASPPVFDPFQVEQPDWGRLAQLRQQQQSEEAKAAAAKAKVGEERKASALKGIEGVYEGVMRSHIPLLQKEAKMIRDKVYNASDPTDDSLWLEVDDGVNEILSFAAMSKAANKDAGRINEDVLKGNVNYRNLDQFKTLIGDDDYWNQYSGRLTDAMGDINNILDQVKPNVNLTEYTREGLLPLFNFSETDNTISYVDETTGQTVTVATSELAPEKITEIGNMAWNDLNVQSQADYEYNRLSPDAQTQFANPREYYQKVYLDPFVKVEKKTTRAGKAETSSAGRSTPQGVIVNPASAALKGPRGETVVEYEISKKEGARLPIGEWADPKTGKRLTGRPVAFRKKGDQWDAIITSTSIQYSEDEDRWIESRGEEITIPLDAIEEKTRAVYGIDNNWLEDSYKQDFEGKRPSTGQTVIPKGNIR